MTKRYIRLLAGAWCVLAAIAGASAATASATTLTFGYTGGPQTWTVPPGAGAVTFNVFGAQGGPLPASPSVAAPGLGGEAQATVPVSPGDTLQINVGGAGADNTGGGGKFNGDGGGGASDVRTGSFGLADRILIAGGGGGVGGDGVAGVLGGAGGAGGGGAGGDGAVTGSGGGGGTLTAGGSAGANDGCTQGIGTAGALFQGGNGDQSAYGSGIAGAGGFNGGGSGGAGTPISGLSGGGGGGGGGLYGGGGGGAVNCVEGGGGGGGGGTSYGPAGTVFTAGAQVGDGFVYATLISVNPVVVTGSQTYGSSSPSFTTATSAPPGDSFSGTLSCSTVNGGTAIAPTLAADGSYTIDGSSCSGLSLTGPTASDYAITYTGSTFAVNQESLTVNPPSATAQYGNVPATFTPTYAGLVNSQTAPATPATCTSPETNTTPPGAYRNITCSGAADSNYAISYGSPGKLTIVKASTDLTASTKQSLLTVTYTARLTRADDKAAVSGKTVVFSVAGRKMCQATTNSSGVASCTVLAVVLGRSTVLATFAGDADYLASSASSNLQPL